MNPSELIEALRDADDEQRQEIKQLLSSQTHKTTRRGLMTAGAGVLSWLAVGQAAGQTNLPRSACEWAGNTDANGYDLLNLNALEGTGITGGERLTNIAGTNLTIDADGNLNAAGGSSAGALTDSGTDTDGGDDYVLPNAADNIDLQGDGAIQNADTISGTSATLQSLSTDRVSITDLGGKGVQNTTQSFASGTSTQVELDAAQFEDADAVTVDTANDQLVVNIGGVRYDIKSNWSFKTELTNGTAVDVVLQVNGTTISQDKIAMGAATQFRTTQTDVKPLSANDAITLSVFHNSGSSEDSQGDERVSLAATIEG